MLTHTLFFIYVVAGDASALVKIIEEQDKELTRLRSLETAVKKIFNDDQIRKMATGKRVVYSHQTIQDAVNTYALVGQTAYETIRENMKLPIPALSTIQRHLQGIDSQPGILKDFFTMMERKMKNISDPRHKKYGLLVDQVALEPKKELDMSTGKIIGYPTLPPNRKNR